jgi:hypothetical protein
MVRPRTIDARPTAAACSWCPSSRRDRQSRPGCRPVHLSLAGGQVPRQPAGPTQSPMARALSALGITNAAGAGPPCPAAAAARTSDGAELAGEAASSLHRVVQDFFRVSDASALKEHDQVIVAVGGGEGIVLPWWKSAPTSPGTVPRAGGTLSTGTAPDPARHRMADGNRSFQDSDGQHEPAPSNRAAATPAAAATTRITPSLRYRTSCSHEGRPAGHTAGPGRATATPPQAPVCFSRSCKRTAGLRGRHDCSPCRTDDLGGGVTGPGRRRLLELGALIPGAVLIWTVVRGQTASTASGRPLSPSQTSMRTSLTPRF